MAALLRPGTRVCPTGLCEFTLEQVRMRDSDGNLTDPVPPRPRGLARLSKKLAGSLQEPTLAQILDQVASGARPVCPQGHELPAEFLLRRTLVFGLVGERGSSKSHYLAALVAELSDGALNRFGLSAQLSGSSGQTYHDLYWRPLYREHTTIEGTYPLRPGESRDPLTVVLRDLATNDAWNVLFYDRSGEQQTDAASQARWNRFLCVADAVFLFLTPRAVGPLAELVPSDGVEQSTTITSAMFDSTADLLRAARHLPLDSDVSGVSTQLLLTKADVLTAVPEFDKDLLEPLDFDEYDLPELLARIEEDSQDVAAFLEDNGARGLVTNVAHRFDRPTFHAVSATGCQLVDGRFAQVRPLRVVEPLLVALSRLGVLRRQGGGDVLR